MILVASLFTVGAVQDTPIACNLNALTVAERQQQADRSERLVSAVVKVEEVADGYRLYFDNGIRVTDLMQWVDAERRCCPFLDFELRLERENGARWLQLTGREGVKAFLGQEIKAVHTNGGASAGNPPDEIRSSQLTDFFVTLVENRLVSAAEAMPANKYPFAPTMGEFKGVRTFGQQVKHLAATNYILAAGIMGAPPPPDAGDEAGPETARTKADILDYLRGSFAALHRAVGTIDERNAVIHDVPISPLIGKATRLGFAEEALIHAYDHYGQMVVYLRMNGIVPPASR